MNTCRRQFLSTMRQGMDSITAATACCETTGVCSWLNSLCGGTECLDVEYTKKSQSMRLSKGRETDAGEILKSWTLNPGQSCSTEQTSNRARHRRVVPQFSPAITVPHARNSCHHYRTERAMLLSPEPSSG